ncbi:hypothetical protein [Acetivibrio straminisolvens]|uniref:hypothetical protein n=1 Tax=Acetivibrio straminisolvens TaxID=253314 RepID=UPI0022405508|nr:hypothetical protein [Acetivibrio straminisolvens]
MTELFDYLRDLVGKSILPVEFLGDKACVLNRWLVKSELADDFTDRGIEPHLNPEGELLLPHEFGGSSKEKPESNWRYYISGELYAFYKYNAHNKLFSNDKNKYLYFVNSVYCTKPQDIVVHFHTLQPTPIRIWINGNLVFTSNPNYVIEKAFFMYHFNEGQNIILVERLSWSKDTMPPMGLDTFAIDLKPYSLVVDKEFNNGFLDDKFSWDLYNTYRIVPDRTVFDNEQDISLLVLPKYFKDGNTEEICVSVINSKGEVVSSCNTTTSKKISFRLDKDIKGTFLLKVEGICESKNSEIYVYRGNFEEETESLVRLAEERDDLSEDVIRTLKGLRAIPDVGTNLIKGYVEFINDVMFQLILQNYYEFERFLHLPKGNEKKQIFDVFDSRVMMFKDLGIDGIFIPYSIYLPKGYSKDKDYPLMVYLMFGYGGSTYDDPPIFVNQGDFSDAIALCISARGTLNNDYIHEVNVVKIIAEVADRFDIDRKNIFVTGICNGAIRSINLAMRFPDLFSAVGSFGGTARLDVKNPDYEYIKNLDNTMLYSFCNVDDFTFNSARILYTLKHFKNHKNWIFYNLAHNEYQDLLSSEKLMKEVIKEKRIDYPRSIRYKTYEPIYNKAYWVRIDYMEDLSRTASIEAQIKNENTIEIKTDNIRIFSILINRKAMGLEREVRMYVDGEELELCLDEFSRIIVVKEDGKPKCETVTLSEDCFAKEYNYIGVDENLMGIKQLYFNKCTVVKPDVFKDSKNALAKKLPAVLQNPIKEKNLNYVYNGVYESEADKTLLGQGNFIYVVDLNKTYSEFEPLWKEIGFEFGKSHINYKNNKFTGDYFAMVKCENPFSKGKHALFVVYNSDRAAEELISFLNTFDINSLFYSEAIVYNNGNYYSYRQ